MLDFLKNEIVVSWIAPIITGLAVLVISTIFIRFIKDRKDEKIVNQANQRFIDSILPFIIQKVEVKASYITSIRCVIVDESKLKNKYVFSELDLRNKLVVDICESKYIDESRKRELIEFTYECFKTFEQKDFKDAREEKDTSKSGYSKSSQLIKCLIISMITSQILITIIAIFNKGNVKLENNLLFILLLTQELISFFGIIVVSVSSLFDSKVSRSKQSDIMYRYYLMNMRDYMIKHRNEAQHSKENKKG